MSANPIILIIFFILITYIIIKQFLIKILKELKYLLFLKKNGKSVEGKIVDVRPFKNVDGAERFLEIFEFKFNNQTVRIESNLPKKEMPNVGAEVDILIDEANPSSVFTDIQGQISSIFFQLFFFLLVFTLLIFLTIKSF